MFSASKLPEYFGAIRLSPLSAFQLESTPGDRRDARQCSEGLAKASCSQLSTAFAAWPAGLGLSPTAFIPGLGGETGILTVSEERQRQGTSWFSRGDFLCKGVPKVQRELKRLVPQTVG